MDLVILGPFPKGCKCTPQGVSRMTQAGQPPSMRIRVVGEGGVANRGHQKRTASTG